MGHSRCNAGYIYLIRSPKYRAVKIGLSINPNTCILAISRVVGDRNLIMERVVWVSNMLEVECFLHDHFKNKHIKDEWFDLSSDDFLIFDQVIKTVKNKWITGEYGNYG